MTRNEFASGGLLLMLVGSVGVFLRAVPEKLWLLLVDQTTMKLTVKDDDAAFAWVKEWFLEQEFLSRIRRVDLDTTMRGAGVAMIPAPGLHLFWRGWRPYWVHFHRGDALKGRLQRQIESLTFSTIGRRQLLLKHFVDEIAACHRRRESVRSALYVFEDYWTCVQAYSPRLLESVVLGPGDKEHLTGDLQRFREARQRYKRLGVPYHRGYLLYGPPGTGKTSLVSALASEFGLSLYLINLTEMNDRSLKAAMHEVPENSAILFEDIDCMRAGHRRAGRLTETLTGEQKSSSQTGVTLSGLLNVLDGFYAPENVIFVMTTNDVDSLDPALLRPGRIDYKLFMGEATERQKMTLYLRFFPEASNGDALAFVRAHEAQTMAEFQGLLLLRIEEAETAVIC